MGGLGAYGSEPGLRLQEANKYHADNDDVVVATDGSWNVPPQITSSNLDPPVGPPQRTLSRQASHR